MGALQGVQFDWASVDWMRTGRLTAFSCDGARTSVRRGLLAEPS
jgi:hypothetical protein